MRLIDKDATKADIEKFNRPLCDDYHMKDYVLNQIINDIEDMPTVEAIPIEWIKKYAHRCIELQDTNYFSFRDLGEIGNGILAMIEDWERNNEDERSSTDSER